MKRIVCMALVVLCTGLVGPACARLVPFTGKYGTIYYDVREDEGYDFTDPDGVRHVYAPGHRIEGMYSGFPVSKPERARDVEVSVSFGDVAADASRETITNSEQSVGAEQITNVCARMETDTACPSWESVALSALKTSRTDWCSLRKILLITVLLIAVVGMALARMRHLAIERTPRRILNPRKAWWDESNATTNQQSATVVVRPFTGDVSKLRWGRGNIRNRTPDIDVSVEFDNASSSDQPSRGSPVETHRYTQ